MIHPLRGLSQTGGRSVASNSFEIQDEIQDEPLNKRVIKQGRNNLCSRAFFIMSFVTCRTIQVVFRKS